jgi:hypothetical protein
VLKSLEREPLAREQLTLVSPYPALVYSGMVPGMVAGHYAPDECTIALAPLSPRNASSSSRKASLKPTG